MSRQAEAADRAAWQAAYRRSRLIVLLWDAAEGGPAFWERLAYAQQLGKPIRLLCLDDTRVPEHLATSSPDVLAARVQGVEDGGQQIIAWLKALEDGAGG